MKILVDEIPIKPSDCLFSNKEKYLDSYSLSGERVILYTHYCGIDGKLCDLENNCKCCSKLKLNTKLHLSSV